MGSPLELSAELRQRYRDQKSIIFERLRTAGAVRNIHATLRALSALADQTLRALWDNASFGNALSLLAVGGYGRGELFPYSDIDVLLLLPERHAQAIDPARLEAFIGQCWDAGLEIGSSVRTIAECLDQAARDITVQTALLESRLVAGDKKLHSAFAERFAPTVDPHTFFAAKKQEMRHRHQRYEDTPYALEPNCKESPGGLRDLQILLWVTRAAALGACWHDLARNGLATAFEVQQIERNEALLSLIRARLHVIANRREDRLAFDLQTAVAETFGYVGVNDRGQRRASETLMRRYYWAAKAVSQLNQILLLNIGERLHPRTEAPTPINARFFEQGGLIEVASDDLYAREPHTILETFLLYQQTAGVNGLSPRTLRALYNARHVMDSAFCNDRVNHATFMRILREPHGITHAFRLMNQTSVLGRYLRAFRKIVGQMQHDLFHVYTVDQHILMVLRNMRRFFVVEHAHEYPFCSQLAAGWDKPWVLYVAALFHDIAKGRGGDHSALGAREVRRFCRQRDATALGADLGITRDDASLIEFLVAEHLTLSHVAQKQDLSDPEVIGAFARRVGSERYLTALYLLTVADIRGTSPRVWNAWKSKLIEDLYHVTLRALGGHMPDPGAEIEARKHDALVLLAFHAQPFEVHKRLWETLDVGYFMRHDAAEIAWHTRQLSRHVPPASSKVTKSGPINAPAQAIVRARLSPVGEGLQVVVYTPDAPDLFARICGYFDQASFSILDAKVHTASNGYALDTFQVITTFLPEHYRELISMVETGLAKTINEAGALPAPSRGRVSRRVRSFPIQPRISLLPDEQAQRWVLSVSASDRAGLLYSIARVLARHRLNLQLAKITTLGERVEDTFLISGPQLQGQRAQLAIETELLEALAAV